MTLDKQAGFGWSVVAASFLVHFIVGGLAYSGGVWQLIFIDYFESTQYNTAWLCAILLSLTALGGTYSLYHCPYSTYSPLIALGGL